MNNALNRLNKFFGAVIAFNIFHQIVSSAGYLVVDIPIVKNLYLISIAIFGVEFLLRAVVNRKLSFLLVIDGVVLINQVFFSIYDLRILRLFRLFDVFSQSRFLLPTNTLIKTIIIQAVAECLAGLIYVNSISPSFPAIFGTWPFVSDLRTGAMSGGSGEQALLSAGCAQMHRFYDLPGGAAAGIADAKLPDMQAGWEQATSNVMAGLSGLNMVYEAAGMHASLLGFCLESLILGNDLIGQALRCVRGIEVTEDSVSLDVIRATCIEGPGHYLGSEQTLNLMQTEYIYPDLGDRTSPKEWLELGKPDLLEKAIAKKNEILRKRSPAALDAETDGKIRSTFNIHL